MKPPSVRTSSSSVAATGVGDGETGVAVGSGVAAAGDAVGLTVCGGSVGARDVSGLVVGWELPQATAVISRSNAGMRRNTATPGLDVYAEARGALP
jgi:hypothetical protein